MQIENIIKASIEAKQALLADAETISTVYKLVNEIVAAYGRGNKILACGNGGSAADAQHFVAEYVGRFYYDRPPLPAMALSTDTSIITAIGNDYGYEQVFSRQVEANGVAGDVLVAISTSGNSISIVNALEAARNKKLITVGLTGQRPAKMDSLCDYLLKMPVADTPRIQECHALLEHIICQLVEERIFPR